MITRCAWKSPVKARAWWERGQQGGASQLTTMMDRNWVLGALREKESITVEDCKLAFWNMG